MSILKKLAGQAVLYGATSILSKVVPYILVPLHTKVLNLSDYGILTLFYAVTAFLIVLYTSGMETSFFRFSTKEGFEKAQVYNGTISVVLLLTLLFSASIVAFAPQIASLSGYPGRTDFLYWMVAIVAVDAISAIPFARLRLENRPIKFAVSKLSILGINLFLNLFFLVILKELVESKSDLESSWISSFYNSDHLLSYIFISNLLSNLFVFLFLAKEFSGFRLYFNKVLFAKVLKYGLPILMMGLAGTTNEMFGRMILEFALPESMYPNYSNAEILGIYGGCYKLSVFMLLAIQSFKYAAEPFFFAQAKDKNAPIVFAEVMKWFVIVCVLIFIGVHQNLSWLSKLLLKKPDYALGLSAVPILLLANMFLGIYYNLAVWFKLTDKTIFGMLLSFGGMFLTIGLNLALIPYFGFMGSAYGTLLCYFSMSLASYWLGNKYYPIPYSIKTISFYISIGLGIMLLDNYLDTFTFIISLPAKLGLSGIFLLIIYFKEGLSSRFSGLSFCKKQVEDL